VLSAACPGNAGDSCTENSDCNSKRCGDCICQGSVTCPRDGGGAPGCLCLP
jgi:hypothetical protein